MRNDTQKLRDAIEAKTPYMIILGKKEMESGKITVRARGGAQKQDVELGSFVAELKKEIAERSATLTSAK